MTRKSKEEVGNDERKRPTAAGSGLAPVNWHNPKPNAQDREWLDSNEDSLIELCLSLLDEIPDAGRLTFKRDPKSNRWLAILFVPVHSAGGELDALSVRGASALDALCLLAYFHLVRFKGEWQIVPDEDIGKWG